MKVVVDTPAWSLVLSRRPSDLSPHQIRLKNALVELIGEGRVVMIGPIRQELSSGIRKTGQFDRVRECLRPFPDLTIETAIDEKTPSQ